jgi:hypothetical protein
MSRKPWHGDRPQHHRAFLSCEGNDTLLENVDTKSLVDKKILEGAFVWAPLRIIGATGSPGNPMVLY